MLILQTFNKKQSANRPNISAKIFCAGRGQVESTQKKSFN